jgi:putative membrane protein insertion efficiency factor
MRAVLLFLLLLPRNIAVALLKIYRLAISPLYGDVCRYYPSCSAYTMQAIQYFGLVRGSWWGVRRISRCHPWAEGGIDDVPAPKHERYVISRLGFVTARGH